MMKKYIDPYGSELVGDYGKLLRDFGIEEFDVRLFPEPNRLMRRGIIFGGRDLLVIADCIHHKKQFYVLSGIMPTAQKIHFGTKMVVEGIKYFQDHGAETYILVADMEAAAARGVDLKTARQNALDFHIPAYVALGLDPRKTIFYFQSDNRDVLMMAYEFARRITLAEFKAIYGSADPGRIMSAVTQVGDILYPQLSQRMPGIIPVGIDQDPHMRLTRDVVARTKSKYNFVPPASVYHKYMPSLDGSRKMSKSNPDSVIELPEDVKSAQRKIRKALTGGRATIEEHKRLGAEVEKDMVFELLKFHLIEDDLELQRIHDEYKAGIMLSGEIKQIACDRIAVFMEKFNSDLEKARKNVDK
ncbi:MAG: tryptophan--tRNA ligase, partial [Candidatus Woesearchaeota archaeon]